MAGRGGVGEALGRGGGGGVWDLVWCQKFGDEVVVRAVCCEASASEHRAPAWSQCVFAVTNDDNGSVFGAFKCSCEILIYFSGIESLFMRA
jgi:hypothetical protein